MLSIYLPLKRGSEQRVVGVAEDDAGVARARSKVVGAVADAGEAVVDVDWIYASSVVMAMKLSKPVVQVI